MKQILIVVLICPSLITNSLNHLFLCLMALCMSSLDKCLLKSFVLFFIGLCTFSLLSWRSYLYILDIKPLVNIWFSNIFFFSFRRLFFKIFNRIYFLKDLYVHSKTNSRTCTASLWLTCCLPEGWFVTLELSLSPQSIVYIRVPSWWKKARC